MPDKSNGTNTGKIVEIKGVVLDAVFDKPAERQSAEALAQKVGVPFDGLWLDVPKEVAQSRVAVLSRTAYSMICGSTYTASAARW